MCKSEKEGTPVWSKLKGIKPEHPLTGAPLALCGSTLILRQGLMRFKVPLGDIVWFHTHIFDARYSSKRAVRVILKNKRQRLITFGISYDIRPILHKLQAQYPGMLITLTRGKEYKEYMKWYRSNFPRLLETAQGGDV